LFKDLSPQEAAKLLEQDKSIILLDVREQWEYDKVHIPDCRFMPISSFMKEMSTLKKDDPLLVYCHHGSRSMQVCMFLIQKGFTRVMNLNGGIDRYANEVDKSLAKY
jgi:rhodanese-related sulfurtransferase